jgi:hypothetical protein
MAQLLDDVNLLDVVPVRAARWEEQEYRVVVLRPRPHAPWYLLPLEWLRFAMAVRRIRLDRVGSAAWRDCDGNRTVGDVARRLRSAFGEPAEPVEERLGHLIRSLRREGLLAYRHPDGASPAGTGGPPTGVERMLN